MDYQIPRNKDTKPPWVHYSKHDPLFWRDEDGTTTACGKTARRIRHTAEKTMVTCPRCLDVINALD